jgi:glycosyltransferase involved in cell wall biosynthesis
VTPTVSILMPAMNVARWIDDAIESVADQQSTDWELIVVDDFSTDNTWARAREWVDADDMRLPLFVLSAAAPLGISAALNWAASMARGRLLMFMGADDVIAPGFLGEAIMCLEREPDATVACPPIVEFRTVAKVDDVSVWMPRFDLDRLHEENCIPGPSVFRRELFDAVRWPADFEETGCEDWARWVLVHRAGLLKPVRIAAPYYHRIREGGLSNRMAENMPAIRAKIAQLHATGAGA